MRKNEPCPIQVDQIDNEGSAGCEKNNVVRRGWDAEALVIPKGSLSTQINSSMRMCNESITINICYTRVSNVSSALE